MGDARRNLGGCFRWWKVRPFLRPVSDSDLNTGATMDDDFSKLLYRLMLPVILLIVVATGAAFLYDSMYLSQLTPERARTALVEHYPELAAAQVNELADGFKIGNCVCHQRTINGAIFRKPAGPGWTYFAEKNGSTLGGFERSRFGSWRAVIWGKGLSRRRLIPHDRAMSGESQARLIRPGAAAEVVGTEPHGCFPVRSRSSIFGYARLRQFNPRLCRFKVFTCTETTPLHCCGDVVKHWES